MVQVSTGGKSQLASAVSVFILLGIILFIGPLFYHLPKVSRIQCDQIGRFFVLWATF